MENVNPNISQLKLSRLTLIAYGFGDFASNMCWTFIGTYLSVFYTDALGLAPALASVLMMAARVTDAIFDPVFGAVAERTRSKYGRFRPYILFGAPVLAILTVVCFTRWGSGGTLTAILAFLAYLLCGLSYTVVNLSYGSLSTVMSTDPDDIAQLNSYRMIGTNLSAVILNAVTPALLIFFSGSQKIESHSYTYVAILFAVLSLPLFYFTALNCKERIHPVQTKDKVKLSETVKSVIKNVPLMLIFAIQLLAMTAFFGRMGVLAYYCLYNIQNPALMALFMSLPSVATVIGIFATKNYIIKVGKKKMAAIGYIGAAAMLLIMFVVGQTSGYSNIGLLLVLNTLYGFFCFSFPIPMAMVTDAINYGEEKFGVRSDGTSYATVSLSTKFGQAMGVSVALAIMGAMGYVANAHQSADALSGINIATNLLMGILYLVCLIPLFFYPLTEKVSAKLIERLTIKRETLDFNSQGFNQLSDTDVVVRQNGVENPDEKVVSHDRVSDIFAMADGELIPLDKVQDRSLTGHIIGTGFAIKPTNGVIVSPVSGTIINIFQAHHAIGIESDEGLELLIHMGIDTSDLEGKPFDIAVTLGQHIDAGMKIADVNLQQLYEWGKGTDILLIITNATRIKKFVIDQEDTVTSGGSIGRAVLK
ncbi:glycoside-pentoside-hexuronide (GPH):cation symporter [Lactiplantibacillus plantarum]